MIEYLFYNRFFLISAKLLLLSNTLSNILSKHLTIRQLIKSRNSIERVGNFGKERKSRDAKYAITSLTLNIMFIIFKMPHLVFFVLNAYLAYFDVYFFNISSFLFYFYTSSSFFVHLATNSVFRREFLLLFRFSKGNEAISSNTVSNTNRITPMQTAVWFDSFLILYFNLMLLDLNLECFKIKFFICIIIFRYMLFY